MCPVCFYQYLHEHTNNSQQNDSIESADNGHLMCIPAHTRLVHHSTKKKKSNDYNNSIISVDKQPLRILFAHPEQPLDRPGNQIQFRLHVVPDQFPRLFSIAALYTKIINDILSYSNKKQKWTLFKEKLHTINWWIRCDWSEKWKWLSFVCMFVSIVVVIIIIFVTVIIIFMWWSIAVVNCFEFNEFCSMQFSKKKWNVLHTDKFLLGETIKPFQSW